ncbi:cytochrome P450, partial [Violaceomyces palustris]
RVILSDPVALQHVLSSNDLNYPKPKDAARILEGMMGPGLLSAEGEVHRRQKRALQPAFSTNCVKNHSAVFQSHGCHLRDKMLGWIDRMSEAGQARIEVDLLRPVSRATLDVIGEAGFGVHIGSLEEEREEGNIVSADRLEMEPSSHPLSRAFDKVVNLMTRRCTNSSSFILDVLTFYFPSLACFPFGQNSPAFKSARRVLDGVAQGIVHQARIDLMKIDPEGVCEGDSRRGQRTDLLAGLMRANQNLTERQMRDSRRGVSTTLNKATLTDNEVTAQVSTMLFAGHETTSVQLTWILWILSKDQESQTRLRDAIRKKQDRELSTEELDSIPYLDWCIQEGLRMFSPIHTTSRTALAPDRIPCSTQHSAVSHVDVTGGTIIVIPIACLNRDKKVWGDDAHIFRPERWGPRADAKGEQRLKRNQAAFLFGPRGCTYATEWGKKTKMRGADSPDQPSREGQFHSLSFSCSLFLLPFLLILSSHRPLYTS